MLMKRLYRPSSNRLLYHYCSAETFQAITTSRNIRFTDINMLNDRSEYQWAYSIFEEAATRLIKRIGINESVPTIEISFMNSIDEIISPIQLIAHPFVSCFSIKPDMLDQWRAYADDGRGFSVGFNAKTLKNTLPATFLKVLYDRESQVKEMMGAIISIYWRKEENPSDFFEDCFLLGAYMTAFKHPAFASEKEVRAIHLVNVKPYGKLFKFVLDNELISNKTITPVTFQVRDNHLVAFTDMRFNTSDNTNIMTDVIIGPKNHSAPGNLFLFLGGLGFTDINLHKSSTPYR